ncbi:MAG: ABC transporter substrate-binding protein [Devosia sp.]|jgi:multiple sugar transport system substrate-binding protein|nr:sugar ABC transporter substrate-binding protein [Devosia sp.]
MRLSVHSSLLALALTASAVALPSAASATDIQMWVRASGATAAQFMIDLWNASHDDKVVATVIPDNQMVTKLATGSQAGDVPDMVSFDLIYMPDFMKAGFLKDITDEMKKDPNYEGVAQAYKDIATYDGKIYGAGFTPDVSVLLWNKDLFKAAGLDPDKAPATLQEIHEDAKKITALGNDTYGYYFSGACPGCNIFVTSPMMVAAGSKLLPTKAGDDALTGDGVKDVLTEMKAMWDEKLVPDSAQADTGANFFATFETGKIGIQGTGGFAISALKHDKPDMNFGIGFIPGTKAGEASAFVGGDVIAIPAASKHADLALQFIHWELTDEAQLEGLAKNSIIPSRPALADNKYFKDEPRVVTTAQALGKGFTPYALHFNDMVNSDSSPWIQMLQTAIFDGDVDGAIKTAQDAMKAIAAQ